MEAEYENLAFLIQAGADSEVIIYVPELSMGSD